MEKQFTLEMVGDGKISVSAGQTILEASLAAGIPHYHACGGKAQCSTCRILVFEGCENMQAMSEKERRLRKRVPFPDNVRLACQSYVNGESVKVQRMIRDEMDIEFYIKGDTAADLEFIGQERELALFFLDIRNFTPFMEAYLPFDVIHIMRRLFTLFRNAIEANKGRIIETAGDGFYAVFGFETSIKDAVDCACKAGFQIFEELETFNTTYMLKNFRHKFQVGIGLHAGRVITGNIGIGVNNNLTVMGLPVNVAARLQGATKTFNNGFVISADAFDLITDKPPHIQKTAQLKGIKEDILCYLVGEAYEAE
jgi:adenylate cyclase